MASSQPRIRFQEIATNTVEGNSNTVECDCGSAAPEKANRALYNLCTKGSRSAMNSVAVAALSLSSIQHHPVGMYVQQYPLCARSIVKYLYITLTLLYITVGTTGLLYITYWPVLHTLHIRLLHTRLLHTLHTRLFYIHL
jgi:hypothetical protein